MCSTPKGGTAKSLSNSKVDSLVADMSAAEYSDMVRRANAGYEKRQQQLAELRATRSIEAVDNTRLKNHVAKIKPGIYQQLKHGILYYLSVLRAFRAG